MAAQPTQPSMVKEMAATAGSVAAGSVVGHVAGGAITGIMSGGSSNQADQYLQEEDQGPCAWESKRFIQCAQTVSLPHSDLSICEGFNEALRQCKMGYGV